MFQEQVSLRDYTTLKVGGPAEYFVSVTSDNELIGAIEKAKSEGLPWRVIGGGSNILVPDAGLPGLTIRNLIGGIEEQVVDPDVYLSVGAGVVFDELVRSTVEKSYWGLENLSHIPGSVGATPVQNVGAYGTEMGDVIAEVQVLNTETMQLERLDRAACGFAYRDSIFKKPAGKKYIVTRVIYKLNLLANPNLTYKDLQAFFGENTGPAVEEVRAAIVSIRSKKFPDWHEVGTAGSFFKNPIVRRVVYEKLRGEYPGLPGVDISDIDVKIPLGWILDNVCGLRGKTAGAVGTYEGQALVIVNHGGATAAEIVAFAKEIEQLVFSKTGLQIEWEVTQLT